MPYRYLDDVATADVAVEVNGETLPDLFAYAADALLNVMVDDLDSVAKSETRSLSLEAASIDLLLVQFLQEIVYYKDAEQLLLRCSSLEITPESSSLKLTVELGGEKLEPDRHELLHDVKAVTFHLLYVEQRDTGWQARFVLDV